MRVTLPSGATAEFRDTLLRGDVRDARKGIVVITQADGTRRSDGSFLDEITGRLITRMLVSWDLPHPVPSQASTGELAQQILDKLDEDDYAALEKAAGPWVERLLRSKSDAVFTHVATGAKVQAGSPEDAEKMAGSPDFVREDGPDPKTASKAIGTSSSASPVPDGQTETAPTP